MSSSAIVHGLFHTAIKTADLPGSLAFYKSVLGYERFYPPAGQCLPRVSHRCA